MAVDIASDRGGAQPTVPTLGDAHRAADALSFLDPGLVLVYGSVADGTADADSDVDLVVVFDDLGDYSQRPLLWRRVKEAAASAIGRRVDVRVTDLGSSDASAEVRAELSRLTGAPTGNVGCCRGF